MIVLEKAIDGHRRRGRKRPRTRADEAKTEYKHLRDTAEERKAAIQAKIDALKA